MTAQAKLGIPLLVSPENMCSSELDELSAMTYVSCYMKEGSPGYLTTLSIIQKMIVDEEINNFTVIIWKH
jgi:filamin